MPFTYELNSRQRTLIYKSEKTPKAEILQALYDSNNVQEYEAQLRDFKSQGHQFRLTDTYVYEIFEDPDLTIDVAIKLQVKNSVITWYFIAPKDETYQTFRDVLYSRAAKAHEKVEAGCDKYYRGTNAYHLKKMHNAVTESGYNHNHYRKINGEDINPVDFAQHLTAFLEAEEESSIKFFPDPTEVQYVIEAFKQYWDSWAYQEPDRSVSLRDQYKSEASQVFDKEDLEEEAEHLSEENPCRTDLAALSASEKAKMELAQIRGGGSELAHTRQAKGSTYRQIATVVPMSDREIAQVGLDQATGQEEMPRLTKDTVSGVLQSAGAANILLFPAAPQEEPAHLAPSSNLRPGNMVAPE